jgi:hypothetical protein
VAALVKILSDKEKQSVNNEYARSVAIFKIHALYDRQVE